jgi:hypothetical protein
MELISVCLENLPLLLKQLRPWVPISSTFALVGKYEVYKDYNPILNQYKLGRKCYLKEYLPILGEGIVSNQDPDSLHCKALKRAKSLGELKIK